MFQAQLHSVNSNFQNVSSTQTSNSMAGIVHDLGNLIQIAVSAINVLGRSQAVKEDPGVNSLIEKARTSLQSAGQLVHQTMGRVRGGPEDHLAVSRTSISPIA